MRPHNTNIHMKFQKLLDYIGFEKSDKNIG
jgi:hypothetical protein